MRRRSLLALGALVAIVAAGWLAWRWAIQTVDVVLVNESGVPGSFSWQPGLFAAEETVTLGGCESKSITLRAGERWHLLHNSVEMNSSAIEVPPLVSGIAIEVWIAPDGSSRFVPPYVVAQPVGAPAPRCSN